MWRRTYLHMYGSTYTNLKATCRQTSLGSGNQSRCWLNNQSVNWKRQSLWLKMLLKESIFLEACYISFIHKTCFAPAERHSLWILFSVKQTVSVNNISIQRDFVNPKFIQGSQENVFENKIFSEKKSFSVNNSIIQRKWLCQYFIYIQRDCIYKGKTLDFVNKRYIISFSGCGHWTLLIV